MTSPFAIMFQADKNKKTELRRLNGLLHLPRNASAFNAFKAQVLKGAQQNGLDKDLCLPSQYRGHLQGKKYC